MSRHAGSLTPSYFEGLYAADPDPWRFATSDYERDKYAATLAALPRRHYARALDVVPLDVLKDNAAEEATGG